MENIASSSGKNNYKPIFVYDEMSSSYLSYAMSVIISRALPDVRDGLKPVHRRIIYAMYKGGFDWSKQYRKSARIVGDVIGKYHPHGDQAVYDALVRLVQDFSMSLPLIDGQGNFGSIDGDPPAAMRYTETKLAKISQFLIDDIEKNTVEFRSNYDETEMEEIYEETNELVETFTTETFEEEMIEEEPMMEEEVTEEPTEMAEEEVKEEENTEMAEEETVEEESTEMVEAEDEETFEEEAQEEESTSETATTSAVQTKKLAKQKKIQQKKAIAKNLDRIMDKIDKDIKDIAKNLAIKNIIKMEAMTSEQASLDMYKNAVFYRPKDIYLDQLNIFDPRQIYPNTSLASYTQNDKIEIKARKLNELNIKKQKLLYELEMLKNG